MAQKSEKTRQERYAQRKLESGEFEKFLSYKVSSKLKLPLRFEKFKNDHGLSMPQAIDKLLKEMDY